MILLTKLILLTTIWVLGLTIATQDGMIAHKVRLWAESKKSLWFDNIIICHWCMPSLHSIAGYGFAIVLGFIKGFTWQLVAIYPLVVMGASIVCGFLWQAFLLLKELSILYENVNSTPE